MPVPVPARRRAVLTTPSILAALVLGLLAGALPWRAAQAFNFDSVVERAQALAAAPYHKPDANLPEALRNLKYDQYRDIRFRPDKAWWHNSTSAFELQFFHQGLYFTEPVKINEINLEGVQEIRFDPAAFDYGANKLDPDKLRGLGFAGFRVHYPVNKPAYKDEIITFLGASYFRALGKDQLYGASARALAIDTGLTSGEEFPRFVEYWIERPAAGAKELKIYALLDSPRVSGAYRFVIRPGDDTEVEVRARLYLRENVTLLGLAPMTSMFYFGENQRSPRPDFRPEVHDSDGLSIASGTGEWIWRPLVNPKRLLVTSFTLTNPRGFGLMQRDRHFYDYEDLEARYDLRPSIWIEPKGGWGGGQVVLVQIPTPDETNDNIVALWQPDPAPKPREPYEFEYRMLWQKANERRPPSSWVVQTRRGPGHVNTEPESGPARDKPAVYLTTEFEGPSLKNVDDSALEADVWADANGQILESRVERNTVNGRVRLVVRVRRTDDQKAVELRAFLRSGNEALSETWSYILPPD